jgi:Yersinia/Haemophilus virulence surface antigen
MPNEMEEAATASGCTQTVRFSQTALLAGAPALREHTRLGESDTGICFGLAFVWMEYKSLDNYDRFFDDVNAWQDKATALKAAGIYKFFQQKSMEEVAASCSLKVAADGEGDAKNKNQLNVGKAEDMQKLAKWLGAAMGDRYFLIDTGIHVMAASGNKLGRLQFFDPNFGVVQTFSCDTLSQFFKLYFATERLRSGYFKKGKPPWLKVTKFKKG